MLSDFGSVSKNGHLLIAVVVLQNVSNRFDGVQILVALQVTLIMERF